MSEIITALKSYTISKKSFIEFEIGSQFVSIEDLVKVSGQNLIDGKSFSFYFEVQKISITKKYKYKVKALEIGYWANALSRRKDFIYKSLFNQDIVLVKDEETIKNIRKSSNYC